jgi:hypothetical protein
VGLALTAHGCTSVGLTITKCWAVGSTCSCCQSALLLTVKRGSCWLLGWLLLLVLLLVRQTTLLLLLLLLWPLLWHSCS